MLKITRYARENPISTRLLGLIILSSSVITLIAILLQLYASFNDDIASLEKRIDQVRISTLASLTKSLWGFDQEQLHLQVEGVLEVEDVVQVTVFWRDWNNQEQVLIANTQQYDQAYIDNNPSQFLVKEFPLIYEDQGTPPQELGSLVITSSLSDIYGKLWQRAAFIAAVQGTKTLLVSVFILWLVHTLLTRHMDTIAQYARQLHLNNLTTTLRLKRKKTDPRPDELDNVVDAINHMRETLLEDIAQREQIELALLSEKQEKIETRRQKNAAEDANRAKSQFLATMSHEIRTPMNGVIGMLEMLRDTPLNDNQKHYLDVIHRSGETLLDIINDILDYSKIEAGKMQLELAEFDLEDLIEDCIQLFGAVANKRHIEFMGGVEPGTPTRLKGDSTRLRQILINLLGNAFKFTNSGHVLLSVGTEDPSNTEQPLLRFTINDSGIGIDTTAQERLFDSFNQADASTTRQYGGTGLGLAICKSLVELMHGNIGVESTKGDGATFWFTARFDTAETTPKQPAPHEPLTGKHMLLAGSSRLAEFIQRHCNRWNVQLTITHSAEQLQTCLAQAQTPFDVIALDQKLPDAEGLALAQTIRKQPGLAQTPLFIFNLTDADTDKARHLSLGPHALMRRPISARTLCQEITGLLGYRNDRSTHPTPAERKQDYARFAHLRVLVAEDNAVNRMVIKGLLGKLHIEPDLVEDGLAALETVRQSTEPYDLILMDCDMPEMDGFEATRHIRDHERSNALPATPIIALTAHAMQEHREAVFASGMNYYLGKPVKLDDLYSTLEKAGLAKVTPVV